MADRERYLTGLFISENLDLQASDVVILYAAPYEYLSCMYITSDAPILFLRERVNIRVTRIKHPSLCESVSSIFLVASFRHDFPSARSISSLQVMAVELVSCVRQQRIL